MAKNDPPDVRSEKLARFTQEAFQFYFRRAGNDQEKKQQITNLMDQILRQFTREAKEILSLSQCPSKWEECPDGSCMPPGEC